jgi:hypothetical protein
MVLACGKVVGAGTSTLATSTIVFAALGTREAAVPAPAAAHGRKRTWVWAASSQVRTASAVLVDAVVQTVPEPEPAAEIAVAPPSWRQTTSGTCSSAWALTAERKHRYAGAVTLRENVTASPAARLVGEGTTVAPSAAPRTRAIAGADPERSPDSPPAPEVACTEVACMGAAASATRPSAPAAELDTPTVGVTPPELLAAGGLSRTKRNLTRSDGESRSADSRPATASETIARFAVAPPLPVALGWGVTDDGRVAQRPAWVMVADRTEPELTWYVPAGADAHEPPENTRAPDV